MKARLSVVLLVAVLSGAVGLTLDASAGNGTPRGVVDVKKVARGTTETLYANDYFRVVGTCVDNGGGDFTALAYIKTRVSHANVFTSGFGAEYLDYGTSDPPIPMIVYPATGTAPAFKAYDYYAEAYAESKDGHVLTARVATGVHLRGADCTFSGLFLDDHSKTPLSPVVPVAAGTTKTLYNDAFFRVEGTCVDNGGGDLTALATISARKDNAIRFNSDNGDADLDFDQADGAVVFNNGVATGTVPAFEAYDYSNEVVAVSASRRALIARVASAVHVHGPDCSFSGLFLKSGAVDVKQVNAGESKVLLKTNQFKVTATCIDNGGGDLTAQMSFQTAQDGAQYFLADSGTTFGLDVADGPVAFDHLPATGTSPAFRAEDYSQEVYAESVGKNVFIARSISGVHVLGGDCTFAGLFQS